MTLEIFDTLDQGTPEWIAARCGVLTASVIGRLLTPTGKVANNDTSRGLTLTLTAERITGYVEEMNVTPAMWRGTFEEPYARAAYAEHYAPVTEIGFMLRDFGGFKIGYSPDGLVGDDGLIEIKSRGQKTHVRHVLAGIVPSENYAQLQTGLLVSGRDWIDYVSFSGGLPLWVKRVKPDPDWQSALLDAAAKFEADVQDIVARFNALTIGLPVMERPEEFQEMEIV